MKKLILIICIASSLMCSAQPRNHHRHHPRPPRVEHRHPGPVHHHAPLRPWPRPFMIPTPIYSNPYVETQIWDVMLVDGTSMRYSLALRSSDLQYFLSNDVQTIIEGINIVLYRNGLRIIPPQNIIAISRVR